MSDLPLVAPRPVGPGARSRVDGAAAAAAFPIRRVVAFTPGLDVPSRRFRVAQLLPALAEHGLAVDERVARFGAYPPRQRWLRPVWLGATLADRVPGILASRSADVTWLQREFASTLGTFERLTARPRVLDVDDAIWLHRGGRFAQRLAEQCESVICGNSFLAEQFGRWNRNVSVVPTAVDPARFSPLPNGSGEVGPPVIGWSGTSAGFPHLYAIEPALRKVLEAVPQARIRVMADRPPDFRTLPGARVEFVRWSAEREVDAIRGMRVGVMPLPDSDWARGKCSYKMLLYMACGVPAVVSPVGMNADVLAHGDVGAGPRTEREWVDALVLLLRDAALAGARGAAGRDVVLRHYAVTHVAAAVAARLLAA
jgi:glycosyltransferase involved in cell wall biosynthesis